MKKADPTSDEELRPEYRREDLGEGVRGKYFEAYIKRANKSADMGESGRPL
jgi:hypothetical protein